MTAPSLALEEYLQQIGRQIGTSDWIALDQDRIDRFADVTDDRQFIHVDPEAAQQTSFGGTIAHGFLSLSMLSALANTGLPKIALATMEINYGFNRVRFLKPVRSGSRVRGVFRLENVETRSGGRWLSTVNVTVEIENEETPAAVAEWLVMTFV